MTIDLVSRAWRGCRKEGGGRGGGGEVEMMRDDEGAHRNKEKEREGEKRAIEEERRGRKRL